MMMDADRIMEEADGWRVECCEEVTSTNDVAAQRARDGASGRLAIFAESQTAGRGQRSNRWLTPKGKDIMCSLLLRPAQPLELWPRVTTLAALAVCKAIEQMLPLQPAIKWPNDIYIGARKVCGLLAETQRDSHGSFLVLGVGLNVNCMDFAPGLAGAATSLLRELPATIREIERESVGSALLRELDASLAQWEDGFQDALAGVRQRSLLIGRNIRAVVLERTVHGRVLDLNHEGHLILQQADGSALTLSSAAEVRVE